MTGVTGVTGVPTGGGGWLRLVGKGGGGAPGGIPGSPPGSICGGIPRGMGIIPGGMPGGIMPGMGPTPMGGGGGGKPGIIIGWGIPTMEPMGGGIIGIIPVTTNSSTLSHNPPYVSKHSPSLPPTHFTIYQLPIKTLVLSEKVLCSRII